MKRIEKEKAAFAARILAVLCAAWGWWGMLYPELTMLPDTYCIVYEEDGDLGNRVRLRSRLLKEITVLLKQERGTYVAGEKWFE